MSEPRPRCVLAFSGGLDTTVAVHWLTNERGFEVITLSADLGETKDSEELQQRALRAGAVAAHVVDAKELFLTNFVWPSLQAGALYQGVYPLATALGRPLIARLLVEVARETGAAAVAHGCTAKGNDQVRFDVGTRTLAPDLEVLAPARVWQMTRADAVAYAEKWSIPIEATAEKIYSIDENLFGRAIECGAIEDPWAKPPEDPYTLTRITDTTSAELTIGFEEGLPVSLDGAACPLGALIAEVGERTGSRGFGRIDMVENRRVGIKSREVYECPGALAIILAHQDLEDLTLERDVHHEKSRLETRWSELVYDGMWYSPLKSALDAFFAETQRYVTGEVRLEVSAPGVLRVTGRRSPVALYDHGLATYDAADTFRHADAEGFVRLWGLGVQTWAARQSRADERPGPTP